MEKAREFQKNIYFCFTLCGSQQTVGNSSRDENTRPPDLPPEKNLYAGQEARVKNGRGTIDCIQIGKGVCQGCVLSPCLFNLYVEYLMRNGGLDETEAAINFAR